MPCTRCAHSPAWRGASAAHSGPFARPNAAGRDPRPGGLGGAAENIGRHEGTSDESRGTQTYSSRLAASRLSVMTEMQRRASPQAAAGLRRSARAARGAIRCTNSYMEFRFAQAPRNAERQRPRTREHANTPACEEKLSARRSGEKGCGLQVKAEKTPKAGCSRFWIVTINPRSPSTRD
jgi:hypothetical protein